jgi:hypothetical protein
MKEDNVSTTQWVQWLGATLVAAFTFTVFAYSNFETKEHAKETKEEIIDELKEMKSILKDINNSVRK